jgi:plasmid stabilization system protein ParE
MECGRRFLEDRSAAAAKRAGRCIERAFELLETHPEAGRPWPDQPELRELPVSFGVSGYLALYRYDSETNSVYVLAFRHQKEAGYQEGFQVHE